MPADYSCRFALTLHFILDAKTMPTKTLLICTVDGSHQPIVTAIKDIQPDAVYFICTSNDPGTGRPGSNVQITGKGYCIKAQNNDDKPSLPNIPTQPGLTENQVAVFETLAGDLNVFSSLQSKNYPLSRNTPHGHHQLFNIPQ
jgi:hypothetical protein